MQKDLTTLEGSQAFSEKALKAWAAHLLSLTQQAIDKAQAANELIKVQCHAQNQISDS